VKFREFRRVGHWPTVVVSTLYFDCSVMAWISMGSLATYVTRDIGVDPGLRFAVVGVPILAGAFLRVVLGSLADRLGFKRVGLACQAVVLAALACAWRGGVDDLPSLYAFGLVLGTAGGAFAVALPQASRWYPPQYQGLVAGVTGTAIAGVLVVTFVLPRVADAWGWQAAYGWLLVPSALTLVLYAAFARESPAARAPVTWRNCRILLRDGDSWWFTGFAAIAYGGLMGLISSLPLYFTIQFGVSGVVAGMLAGCIAVFGAASRAVGGWVADRIGGIRTLQTFFLVVVVGFVALSLVPTDGLADGPGGTSAAGLPPTAFAILGLLLVNLLALGMSNGALFQLIPQRFRHDIGVMSGLTGLSGGVGGYLLARALGSSHAVDGSFALGFQFFALLALVGFIGLSAVKSRWRTTWGAVSGARI
jgi:NNP family nitrate/nitrite transporter-like MFS transporter